MKSKKNKRKLKKKHIIIIAIVLFVLTITFSYGRYIYNGLRNYYLSTKSFYFNSDKMSDNGAYYQLDNWSGVEPVTITFNMDSKKNNLVASPDNISYDIEYECSSNVTCDASKETGLIMSNTHTDSFSITMTPNVTLYEGDYIELEVSASATSPYTKTISGRFKINVGEIGLSYEINDESGRAYLDFNITNTLDYYKVLTPFESHNQNDRIDISEYLSLSAENKKKCASAVITLSFSPNILRLDMTNEAFLQSLSTSTSIMSDGYDYLNSVTFRTDAVSSNSIRFYKLNTNNNYTYPFVTNSPIITFSSE
jgi:hypothetical protein